MRKRKRDGPKRQSETLPLLLFSRLVADACVFCGPRGVQLLRSSLLSSCVCVTNESAAFFLSFLVPSSPSSFALFTDAADVAHFPSLSIPSPYNHDGWHMKDRIQIYCIYCCLFYATADLPHSSRTEWSYRVLNRCKKRRLKEPGVHFTSYTVPSAVLYPKVPRLPPGQGTGDSPSLLPGGGLRHEDEQKKRGSIFQNWTAVRAADPRVSP